jgi:hypothetical protein
MLTAKEELALTDLEGTRKYLDEISFNIRGIFHGDHSEECASEPRPVDIAESLMDAVDIFTYALERLTHLPVGAEDLPKINSSISSMRYISECIEKEREDLKGNVSDEYYGLLVDKLDDLNEVIDDVERVFFELPYDKDFMDSVNRLFGLQ